MQFFLFGLYTFDVLRRSQFEWLVVEELKDKSRNVSHEGNSSDDFNLNLLFRSGLFKATFLALVLVYGHSPFLLGKGFEDLMTVNLARYKPTGEYVTVRRINLEACSNEMVTFLQVIKCEWDAGRVGS